VFVSHVVGPERAPGVIPPPPLPEPAGLPRRVVYETGRRRAQRGGARSGRQEIRVGGRLGFGVAGRLAGPLPVRAAFVLDALAIARIPLSRGRVAFGLSASGLSNGCSSALSLNSLALMRPS